MGCNHSGMNVVVPMEEEEVRPKENNRRRSRKREKERQNKQKQKDDRKSKKESKTEKKTSIVRRKWDEFRMWISCGSKTTVKTFEMDQSSDGIAATQSRRKELTSSPDDQESRHSRHNVHSSVSGNDGIYVTQSDPLPGRRLIRPKAAKGERPKVRPHPAFSLPGVVVDGDDQDVPTPSHITYTTMLNTSSKQRSGKAKKERPKAAKGQRTVNKINLNTEPTQKECLDAWMRRQLLKERRKERQGQD